MSTVAAPVHPWLTLASQPVTVDQYRTFKRDGYLIVHGLVLPEHVAELKMAAEDLMYGRTHLDHLPPVTPGMTQAEMEKRLLRIHQGHFDLEIWEKYLLYPRILDVVQALHGPDILALQTMMFIKGPGSNGQGFHQDAFYIPTFPDTVIGAWIAIDPADEENGCLWMSPGSQNEPIYPPANGYGYGDALEGIPYVENVGASSNDDDDRTNTLKPIAEQYSAVEVPAVMQPGDVAFFAGHVFHRSKSNKTSDRFRRSFVNHYCNARSFLTWSGGNQEHILARGNTHLPFAQPKFGTPCAANAPERSSVSDFGAVPNMLMGMPDGTIQPQPATEDAPHDH